MGLKTAMVTGLVLAAAGLGWFSQVSPTGSFLADILGPSIVVSAGGGLASVAINISAVTAVPAADSGLAGGLVNVSQQVGSALGLAILATLASTRTHALLAAGASDPVAR
ncbi:multidrug efflux MFS transporter [Fodinicola feengrottensis]|uniref:multidrug efflux MFS transporter n=1 Tax=Fodinicola feengrottensis TaxID=435914 RepID=UPI0013CF7ABC|nr:multidrug efflux MFS transporter [Fodinicola feengrottensis]